MAYRMPGSWPLDDSESDPYPLNTSTTLAVPTKKIQVTHPPNPNIKLAKPPPNLLNLRPSIHGKIISYLAPTDSTCLGLTCKRFYRYHRSLHGTVSLREVSSLDGYFPLYSLLAEWMGDKYIWYFGVSEHRFLTWEHVEEIITEREMEMEAESQRQERLEEIIEDLKARNAESIMRKMMSEENEEFGVWESLIKCLEGME